MKTRKNFRLSDQCLFQVGELMGELGCDATQVIERGVAALHADVEKFDPPTPVYPAGKPIVTGVDLASGPSTVAEATMDTETGEVIDVKVDRPAKPLTRAEREARNLAFQKQTGMSGGKKK